MALFATPCWLMAMHSAVLGFDYKISNGQPLRRNSRNGCILITSMPKESKRNR
jgi:hypothetical protein